MLPDNAVSALPRRTGRNGRTPAPPNPERRHSAATMRSRSPRGKALPTHRARAGRAHEHHRADKEREPRHTPGVAAAFDAASSRAFTGPDLVEPGPERPNTREQAEARPRLGAPADLAVANAAMTETWREPTVTPNTDQTLPDWPAGDPQPPSRDTPNLGLQERFPSPGGGSPRCGWWHAVQSTQPGSPRSSGPLYPDTEEVGMQERQSARRGRVDHSKRLLPAAFPLQAPPRVASLPIAEGAASRGR